MVESDQEKSELLLHVLSKMEFALILNDEGVAKMGFQEEDILFEFRLSEGDKKNNKAKQTPLQKQRARLTNTKTPLIINRVA